MFKGLEHTGVASPNPEALAQWYVDTLGFVINYTSSSSRTRFVKAPNGTMFEFIESKGDRAASDMKSPGLRHLAIEVDSFESDVAALKAKGVNFLGEPQDLKGNKVVFFTDPDGNILHLIQREKPLP